MKASSNLPLGDDRRARRPADQRVDVRARVQRQRDRRGRRPTATPWPGRRAVAASGSMRTRNAIPAAPATCKRKRNDPLNAHGAEVLRSRGAPTSAARMKRELVTLHGRVQGVGFREQVSRSRAATPSPGPCATLRRPRPRDRRRGRRAAVDAFVAAVVEGRPYFARVDHVERRPPRAARRRADSSARLPR